MIFPLGRVHMVVRRASTETTVANYVVAAWRDVTDTRGSVRGRVTSAISVPTARESAGRPVKADVQNIPESAPAAWMAGTEIRVTKSVALVVR